MLVNANNRGEIVRVETNFPNAKTNFPSLRRGMGESPRRGTGNVSRFVLRTCIGSQSGVYLGRTETIVGASGKRNRLTMCWPTRWTR